MLSLSCVLPVFSYAADTNAVTPKTEKNSCCCGDQCGCPTPCQCATHCACPNGCKDCPKPCNCWQVPKDYKAQQTEQQAPKSTLSSCPCKKPKPTHSNNQFASSKSAMI